MKDLLIKKLVQLTIGLQEIIINYLEKGKQKEKKEDVEQLPLSGEGLSLDSLRDQEFESHVTFYSTENAEVAKDAEKAPAHGIDKFDEKDTFDPDEADDHQTNRDRNQNSDLAQRFSTGGER